MQANLQQQRAAQQYLNQHQQLGYAVGPAMSDQGLPTTGYIFLSNKEIVHFQIEVTFYYAKASCKFR